MPDWLIVGFVAHYKNLNSSPRKISPSLNPSQDSYISTVWCVGQALSRSYGRFFAEFLKDPSLVRLGLLDLTTCVGFGTESIRLCLEVFLESVLPKFARPRPHIQTQLGLHIKVSVTDLPITHPRSSSTNPIRCFEYNTPSLHRNVPMCRNINLLAIASPSRDRLRPD